MQLFDTYDRNRNSELDDNELYSLLERFQIHIESVEQFKYIKKQILDQNYNFTDWNSFSNEGK